MGIEETKEKRYEIGLCRTCQFMRLIESERGSRFYLCQRSATDSTFPKYPRLPVLECRGYACRGYEPHTATEEPRG